MDKEQINKAVRKASHNLIEAIENKYKEDRKGIVDFIRGYANSLNFIDNALGDIGEVAFVITLQREVIGNVMDYFGLEDN